MIGMRTRHYTAGRSLRETCREFRAGPACLIFSSASFTHSLTHAAACVLAFQDYRMLLLFRYSRQAMPDAGAFISRFSQAQLVMQRHFIYIPHDGKRLDFSTIDFLGRSSRSYHHILRLVACYDRFADVAPRISQKLLGVSFAGA